LSTLTTTFKESYIELSWTIKTTLLAILFYMLKNGKGFCPVVLLSLSTYSMLGMLHLINSKLTNKTSIACCGHFSHQTGIFNFWLYKNS
jgi:hypothetical protein